MVQVEQRHPLLFRQPQQPRADQRSARQIEGARGLLAGEAGGLGLLRFREQPAQIHETEADPRLRVDGLLRLPSDLGEGGTQHLVPVDDRGQGTDEGFHPQLAGQTQSRWDVVRRATRLQPVQEPQTLLSERQGKWKAASTPGNVQRPSLAPGRIPEEWRQPGDRRMAEERLQRQIHAKRPAQAGRELRGEQRVAAQLEEVVVDADTLDSQEV